MIRQMRFLSSSSGVSRSERGNQTHAGAVRDAAATHTFLHLQIHTLIHAVEYLIELLLGVFTVMLLPTLSSFAPQDHQFPLFPPEGSKVGYFHNDGAVEGVNRQHMW